MGETIRTDQNCFKIEQVLPNMEQAQFFVVGGVPLTANAESTGDGMR